MKDTYSHGPLNRSFFSSDVLNVLRVKIILGELKPGEKLVEEKIAAELGVSRGPVRNALLLLQKEGLIVFLSNGRTEVLGFSVIDLSNLYEIRLLLETKAIELIFVDYEHRSLEHLKQLNVRMQKELRHVAAFTNLDLQYHNELVELSGNKYLLQSWQSLRPTLEAVLRITNMGLDEYNNVALNKGYVMEHHNKITDALLNGDRSLSISLIKEHLETGKDIMKEKLSHILNGTAMITSQSVLNSYEYGH